MIENQELISRDFRDAESTTMDICPHISITAEYNNERYFIQVPAIFYCKVCEREFVVDNGCPE